MKKEYISSAKRKIIGILLVFIVPLLILLFSYNWYVMRYVYTNTVQHAERTLEIYSQPVVNELSVTEEYFEYIVRKDLGFRRLIYADTERRAIARLKDASEKLSAIYSTALNMTGHIIYHSGSRAKFPQSKEQQHQKNLPESHSSLLLFTSKKILFLCKG